MVATPVTPRTPATPVTVLLALRDTSRRAALAAALGADAAFEVVGETGDGSSALRRIRQLEPAVTVAEADLPELGGAEIARELRRIRLPSRVVILAPNGSTEPLVRAIALGAAAGLPADTSTDRLAAIVRAVARGRTCLPEELQEDLVRRFRDQWHENRPQLSTRQFEVLTLVADGLSAPQIAEVLGLGRGTIKTHLEHLYSNLGVADRAAAVAVAMRAGILS
jgi:two-component system nitrate/nitrite response regulator NarL